MANRPGLTGAPARSAKASLRSVSRALDILRAFVPPPHTLGISDLARVLGLSKGTVHLLATTLESEGFLERNSETGKYTLGPAVHLLTAAGQRDIRLAAREPLQKLYVDTSFPAYLAIRLGRRAVIVEKAAPTLSFLPVLDVGTPVPFHSSALGKALLANAPDSDREAVLAELEASGIVATTPKTITSLDALREELAGVVRDGLAYDREESLPGVFCLASPVRDALGDVLGAVSVAAPAASLPEGPGRETVARLVRDTAAQVSYRLGYRGAKAGG